MPQLLGVVNPPPLLLGFSWPEGKACGFSVSSNPFVPLTDRDGASSQLSCLAVQSDPSSSPLLFRGSLGTPPCNSEGLVVGVNPWTDYDSDSDNSLEESLILVDASFLPEIYTPFGAKGSALSSVTNPTERVEVVGPERGWLTPKVVSSNSPEHGRNLPTPSSPTTHEYKEPRVIPWGRFKGRYDTRASLCMHRILHSRGSHQCVACRHSLVVPSPLRHEASGDGNLDARRRIGGDLFGHKRALGSQGSSEGTEGGEYPTANNENVSVERSVPLLVLLLALLLTPLLASFPIPLLTLLAPSSDRKHHSSRFILRKYGLNPKSGDKEGEASESGGSVRGPSPPAKRLPFLSFKIGGKGTKPPTLP